MINLCYFSAFIFTITLGLPNNTLGYFILAEEESNKENYIEVIEVLDEPDKYASLISQKEELKTSTENEKLELQIKNNHLALFGIGITSILFSTILVLLFKQDKQFIAEEEQEKNKSKSDIISDNDEISESEELVFQPNFKKPDLKRKKELGEDKLKTSKFSENTVLSDISKEKKHNNKPIVSSDIMGKLTIETSSTTEIDVVFELIQDLQNNSNSNDLTRQKDLRRKAIWELAQTNDFRAIKPLVQTISRVNSLEKNLILDAITQIANYSLETINNVLLISLEDESVEVRKNAIQDLTTLYQSMSLITAHLSKMTEDSDQEVRRTAMWALEQFKQMSVPVASVKYADKRK